MIPVESIPQVKTSGSEGSAEFDVSPDDVAHIMDILRSRLYSDKPLAVLREYAANAWDANRVAGRGDKPIHVTLPTVTEPTLKIRDFGPGLSQEEVFTVYNRYGRSTKRDTNDAVGSFGIGSKSGFAYSDSFTIVSYHGGRMKTYVAVIDASKKGRIDLLDVQDSSELTGIEIQVPIRPQDVSVFQSKASSLYSYFNPQPVLLGRAQVSFSPLRPHKEFPGLGRVFTRDTQSNYWGGHASASSWTAIMGCIPYSVRLDQLPKVQTSARNVDAHLYVDIGELEVAANREELEYKEHTQKVLTDRINSLVDKYIEHLLEGIDKLSPWDRRLRIASIKEMYLPVPGTFKEYEERYIQIEKKPSFTLKTKGYRDRFEEVTSIRAQEGVKLVWHDDTKRSIKGLSISKGNEILVIPGQDQKKARQDLDDVLAKAKITGIPMIMSSTLGYIKPTVNRTPLDHSRARAQVLVLDPSNIHDERKSMRWKPEVRTPSKDDVYVVIEGFVVPDLSDFYDKWKTDNDLVRSAGVKIPPVIGYRHTKSNPVDKSKLLGTDYKTWREKSLIDLLLTGPGIKDLLEHRAWNGLDEYGQQFPIPGDLQNHPIAEIIGKVKAARNYRNNGGSKQHAVNHVWSVQRANKEDVASKALAQIHSEYPLTRVYTGLAQFASDQRDMWYDYIRLVDSQKKAAAAATSGKNKKAA